jgi:hypothetical protein
MMMMIIIIIIIIIRNNVLTNIALEWKSHVQQQIIVTLRQFSI